MQEKLREASCLRVFVLEFTVSEQARAQFFSSKRQSNRQFALTRACASADSGKQRMSAIRETSRFANSARRYGGARVDHITAPHRFSALARACDVPLTHHTDDGYRSFSIMSTEESNTAPRAQAMAVRATKKTAAATKKKAGRPKKAAAATRTKKTAAAKTTKAAKSKAVASRKTKAAKTTATRTKKTAAATKKTVGRKPKAVAAKAAKATKATTAATKKKKTAVAGRKPGRPAKVKAARATTARTTKTAAVTRKTAAGRKAAKSSVARKIKRTTAARAVNGTGRKSMRTPKPEVMPEVPIDVAPPPAAPKPRGRRKKIVEAVEVPETHEHAEPEAVHHDDSEIS